MSHARYTSSVSYNYSLKIQFKYHIQPNCYPLRLSYVPLLCHPYNVVLLIHSPPNTL